MTLLGLSRSWSKARRVVYFFVYYYVARKLPHSGVPGGKISKIFRATLARRLLRQCGHGVNIERGADFSWGAQLSVGNRSGIGIDAWIRGDVTIGNDVMMGPQAIIYAYDHLTSETSIPMAEQGMAPSVPIVIEDDVWIGARVTILKGVTVQQGAIVGAGSVVTRDVPPYSVAVGNPARVVASRLDVGE